MRGGKERKEEEEENEEKEEEKIPHMWEIIGHLPLWGHCPVSPSTWSTIYLGRALVPLTTRSFYNYLLLQRFLAYCLCQNALVTFSTTAPAQPQVTEVAMYPALLVFNQSPI